MGLLLKRYHAQRFSAAVTKPEPTAEVQTETTDSTETVQTTPQVVEDASTEKPETKKNKGK